MFNHSRRSSYGQSTPSWLLRPGPILLKAYNRNSKYEPLVEEVTLLEANPEYAHVRMSDGRETTVSTRHLAPTPLNIEPNLNVKPLDEDSENNCPELPTEENERASPSNTSIEYEDVKTIN